MIKCKVNPRRTIEYPMIMQAKNGNVWLLSSLTSATLLVPHPGENRKTGYHTDGLSTTPEMKVFEGSITLSNE